jgi:hypothetical protein
LEDLVVERSHNQCYDSGRNKERAVHDWDSLFVIILYGVPVDQRNRGPVMNCGVCYSSFDAYGVEGRD